MRAWIVLVIAATALMPIAARGDTTTTAVGTATVPDSLAPSPPGRLVDAGGFRLHLWCTGSGGPTVVLVPGSSDHSFGWVLVQPEVAKTTRVCSCDRGGAAWSELGPRPRTKTQEAFNLYRALRAAGEPGPYVLVGQSMGGDVVRFFAMQHPDEVAGLVLVDAGTPDGMTNLNGVVGTTRSFSKGRPIPAPRESLGAGDALTAEGVARIRAAVGERGMRGVIRPPYHKLPPEQQRWRRWALSQPRHFVSSESGFLGEEAERVHQENLRIPQPLADLPLAMLCRDTTVEKAGDPQLVEHQQAISRLSKLGSFEVVKGAGHHFHIDRPDAVIAAINRVVEQARKKRAAK